MEMENTYNLDEKDIGILFCGKYRNTKYKQQVSCKVSIILLVAFKLPF